MSQDNSISISEQAAHWWVVLHDGDAAPADKREFGQWVARAPERVEAYLRVARTHAALSHPELRWPKTPSAALIEAAIASPPEPSTLTQQWAHPERHRNRRFPARVAVGLAAALLVAIGAGWLVLSHPLQVQTRFGEQRSVLLGDGSRVTLNTSAKIEVSLRGNRRVVDLIKGEALFEVAHEAKRPFDVRVGNVVVRALGTQFDIDQRPARTTVTVVEGRVAMIRGGPPAQRETAVAELSAGDRVLIDEGGSFTLQHGVNLEEATAWTRRQLIFERRPMGEIAAEFNRYNVAQIEIRSPALQHQELTGTFQSDDPASFVAFIAGIEGVRVADDGTGGYTVTLEQSGSGR